MQRRDLSRRYTELKSNNYEFLAIMGSVYPLKEWT